MSSTIRPQTIALLTAGAAVTGIFAYAVYFDHRRRTDPEFRRNLKRESKKQARAARELAEAQDAQQRKAIREAVDEANATTGLPSDPEEIEQYFMQEIAKGEALCQDGSDPIEGALCFYRAMKIYPNPSELLNIYDKTVPKPVIDILAEMIAYDPKITARSNAGSAAGVTAGSGADPTSVDE